MNKKDLEKWKKITDSIIHRITLRTFRIGCDELNFRLLEFCSSAHTSEDIQNKFKISPMSVSRRTKALRESSLLKQYKNPYIQSDLGKHFLNIMAQMKKDVLKEMSKLV